jgi:starch synthase
VIPNVIHAHDWPTALVSVYLATGERRGMFRRVASVLSLHEVMYQGRFHGHERAVAQVDDEAFQADGAEEYGELNVLKGGGLFADMLVATSPERAAALCTPDGGYGLDAVFARRASDLTGITSGTDAASWEEAARQHVEVYRRAIEKRRATG